LLVKMKTTASKSAAPKSAGFTLIELMIVLVIAGLALTIGLPGFQRLIARQQLNTAVNDLFHAIQLTRSEALRRNRVVQLAPLDDTDWAQGWRIYVSTAENGPYRDGDRVVLQRGPLPAGVHIDSRAGTASEIYIAYNGGGRSVRRNRMTLAGSWRVHLKRESRIIVINFQGRVRICNPAQDRQCKLDSPETDQPT
jgi:type IV fimbrial biogenesis protein FimT